MDHTNPDASSGSQPLDDDALGFDWPPLDGPGEQPGTDFALPTQDDPPSGPLEDLAAPGPLPLPFDSPQPERTWQTGRLFPEFEPVRSTHATPLYGYPIYDEPEPVPPDAPRRRRRRWSTALLALLAGAIGALVTFALLTWSGALDREEVVAPPPPSTTAAAPPEVVEIREIITEGDASAVAIAVGKKVVPSIVTVQVGGLSVEQDFEEFGSGSGVVLAADGLIVTNHHVIEDADETRVVFQDGRIYDAEIVGSDPITDLAVLRIDGNGFDAIEFGQTAELSIGDRAIAVGNPLGLRGGASLTVGVVSAFDREVRVGPTQALFGMLQTDAPITQGSSGGALVDRSGNLIGITTAIGVSSAGAEGIGFAIPIELVSRITQEIIATGGVRHAFLGVQLSDSFEAQPDGAVIPNGALIDGFAGEPSAAEQAGLETGDRVVRYDDIVVRTRDDLINGLRRYRVGDVIEIEVVRDGERVTAEVTLGERPSGL